MAEIIEKSDARGDGWSSSITVTPEGVRLPDQPAKYLIISNWNVENEPTFTSKNPGVAPEDALEEIYWGFRGVYAHQLFTSRTTELIPVNNLEQISLRSRPGQNVTVWYSWIL